MTTEISKPVDLSELLKDKVKQEFINIIPDEVFKSMVDKIWQDYMGKRIERWGSRIEEKPSKFYEQLVRTVEKHVGEKIENDIRSRLLSVDWSSKVDEFVIRVIKASSDDLISSFLSKILTESVDEISDKCKDEVINELRTSGVIKDGY